jgi:intraflagellar transport protein 56
MASCFFILK